MEQHCTDLSHPTNKYALDVVEGRIVAGPIVRAACKRHLDDLRDGPARGFVFSEARAGRILRFFPTVIRLNGGEFEGRTFELAPAQQFIVGSIFGWVESATGNRRFRIAYIEQGKGNGKALALDTPIPTPAGWTTMGEIQVGDRLFDENGRQCIVTAATEVMYGHECYEVKFDDGQSIVADADHLWKTESREYSSSGGIKVRTTKRIAETLRRSNGKYQSVNHSIPTCKSIDCAAVALPLSPYALGAWLGDGDSDKARITIGVADAELAYLIEKAGVAMCPQKPHKNGALRYRMDGITPVLRGLNLIGNKHIPWVYLRSAWIQRVALLQGLMDTDGYISKQGTCAFYSTNEELAAGVLELVTSLGMKATVTGKRAMLYGKDCGNVFSVNFQAPDTYDVFALPRKAERQKKRHNRRKLSADRRIVSCDRVPSVPVRCISVSSPSQMFLAGARMVPTHNSPLAAGIGLYGLIADGEARAEVYSAGSKKEQAMILFKDAVAAFEMSPALSGRIKPSGKQPNVWNLYDEKTGSYFRPISSDEGQSGHRPHMALVDELHEHKNAQVVNMMSAGQKGRTQPLVFIITNSGSDKTSACGEYHDKAERIAFGMERDDRFFAFVCSLDPGDDPFVDEECWIKANPLLGVTIQKQYIREQIAAATMPSKKSDVMRLNFCMWTAADNPFIDFNSWSSSKAKYDLSIFSGRDDVSLGLDLSQVCDLTAGVFSIKRDGVIHWWAEFWIPEGVVATKVKDDKVPYDHWIREGWVRATPGNTIDLGFVAKDLKELQKKHNFKLRSVPYDRWRIEDFKKACDSVDFRVKDQLQEFGQGFKDMSPAIDEFERSLMDSKFRHPGNPCLDWCAANAVVISDPAGGRKLDKGSNQKKRIDGIIAGIMSHHATSLLPEQALPTIRWL